MVLKDTFNTLNNIILSEDSQALSMALSLTGYSLRDLKGRNFLEYFKKTFKEKIPNGIQSEIQRKILSDSLIEVQDYIQNNSNLQDEVLKEIGKVIVNGIITEDELTIIYISKLKKLNFLQLKILFYLKNITLEGSGSSPARHSSKLVKNISESNEFSILPEELIVESISKLSEYNLLKFEGIEKGSVPQKERRVYVKYLTGYGHKIIDLLE